MLKYCWKRLRFIWWKMFKDVQRKLKELSHLRWNSLKTWSISLQKFHLWTYFNIFTGWKALKDGNYFNVFNIISTDLFQHYFNSIISTNMSFNVFQHIYFNLFQRYFNIYFNVFTGWKPLKDEIYFNIISTYLIRRVHWWNIISIMRIIKKKLVCFLVKVMRPLGIELRATLTMQDALAIRPRLQ